MVAIMQLNGEGTPVDVPGARATFRRLVGSDGFMDADAQALDTILRQREKHPGGKSRHIDFCADVAGITPSLGYCSRREEDRAEGRDQKILDTTRTRLADDARPVFDAAVEAFRSFVAAEGERTYEKYIDGTIRAQASTYAESFARADFMRAVQLLAAASSSGPTPRQRPFAAADRALNEAYRADVGGASAAYKTKSRTTQHRWVRYREAMAKLAAARWPARPDAEDLARALVTGRPNPGVDAPGRRHPVTARTAFSRSVRRG